MKLETNRQARLNVQFHFSIELFVLWLTKLSKNSCSRLRVQECDAHLLSTRSWSLINKSDTLLVALCKRVSDTILDSERHVVYSLASFFHEFSDSTLRACWLEEFEFHFAYFQESRYD